MKVVEFLKSLVIPKEMKRYRYMSVLISVIIFFLEVYLINWPLTMHIKNLGPNVKEMYNHLVLTEISESLADYPHNEQILKEIASLECEVSEGYLKCANLEKTVDTEEKVEYAVFEREIVFEKDGVTKHLKFIINLNLVNPDEEKIVYDLKTIPYVDYNEYYQVVLTADRLIFQAHQKGIDEEKIEHNGNSLNFQFINYTYTGYIPEFTLKVNEASARNIGERILDAIVNAYLKQVSSINLIQLFMLLFIMPLFIILVSWILFRSNGKLKTFREYYNIAAIASIVPILIAFIVVWFLPGALDYYPVLFILFCFFALYKINSAPDEVY